MTACRPNAPRGSRFWRWFGRTADLLPVWFPWAMICLALGVQIVILIWFV